MRLTVFVTAILFASLAPAAAQDFTAAQREACKADYEQFCRGTIPGGGRVLALSLPVAGDREDGRRGPQMGEGARQLLQAGGDAVAVERLGEGQLQRDAPGGVGVPVQTDDLARASAGVIDFLHTVTLLSGVRAVTMS